MPYFQLKGMPILPNNANCPVEVISNDITTECADFFKKADGSGRVELTGVTNQNYHLVTPNDLSFNQLKNDVFEGKLQINGVSQVYCAKGMAPLGTLLAEYSNTSTSADAIYYFFRRYDGYCELQDSNGSTLTILSTPEQNRKVFTFYICGGGGGGAAGSSGFGWAGGGGGGGAAAIFASILFKDIWEATQSSVKIKIIIGHGGANGTASSKEGSAGTATTLTYVSGPSTINNLSLSAGGGTAGVFKGSGGTSSCTITIPSSAEHIEFLSQKSGSGASGNYGQGDSTTILPLEIFSVNSNILPTIGNFSGGSQATQGGGGGASLFANGANGGDPGGTGTKGSGGGGGDGAFGTGRAGGPGGYGFVQIYY